MLTRSYPLAAPPLSFPVSAPASCTLANFHKTASLRFRWLGHSSDFHFPLSLLPSADCATLCQKPSGVGMLSPTAKSPFRPLTPMKSKRFAKIARNHFRMKTFRDTPGGGGIRTFPLQLVRHFAPLNAKLSIPARLSFGGAW